MEKNIESIRKTGILFLENIIIDDYLLSWKEVCDIQERSIPYWFKEIEDKVLDDMNERKAKDIYKNIERSIDYK